MTPTKAQRRKHAESFFFERAQALLTCWPTGAIDATGEEPDIVVDGVEVRYGVEVTEMLRGDIRAIEETRRVICEKAKTLFLRSVNAGCLDVKVVFRDHLKLNPRVRDTAATDLAEIVRSRVSSVPAGVFKVRLKEGTDFESDLFSAVWLHHHPVYTGALWQSAEAWWVPVASVDHIQATMDKKECKIAAYHRRVEEVWLLIVLQGCSGSASWSVDDAVFSHPFSTTFDGVVLLDYAMNRANVLTITP